MKRMFLWLIVAYQKTLSFDHGLLGVVFPFRFCRFYPSCSEYARRSILRFGVFRGGDLAMRRFFRCHPWNSGGYDPVPGKLSQSFRWWHSKYSLLDVKDPKRGMYSKRHRY